MPPLLLLLLTALVPLGRPDSRLQYYYGPADKSAETWAAWWRDFTQATRCRIALDTNYISCARCSHMFPSGETRPGRGWT